MLETDFLNRPQIVFAWQQKANDMRKIHKNVVAEACLFSFFTKIRKNGKMTKERLAVFCNLCYSKKE